MSDAANTSDEMQARPPNDPGPDPKPAGAAKSRQAEDPHKLWTSFVAVESYIDGTRPEVGCQVRSHLHRLKLALRAGLRDGARPAPKSGSLTHDERDALAYAAAVMGPAMDAAHVPAEAGSGIVVTSSSLLVLEKAFRAFGVRA